MSSDFDVKLNLVPIAQALHEIGTKANEAFLSISENIADVADLAAEYFFDDGGEISFTASTFAALGAASYGVSPLVATLGSAVLLSYNASMKEATLGEECEICHDSSVAVDVQDDEGDEKVANDSSHRPSVEANKQQADLFKLAQVTVIGSIAAKLFIGDSAVKFAVALPLASRTFSFFNQK